MRCGAAAVDLTPRRRVTLAGNGPSGLLSRGVATRLEARALALEDASGARAALVHVDLMSATRPVVERASSIVERAIALRRHALLVSATHTHHGPGSIYGDSLYDTLASSLPGHDHDLVEQLAQRIAHAVIEAFARLTPGLVGVSVEPLWGAFRNAALTPFGDDPEAARWADPGWPGHGAPTHLSPAHRAIDPRITVIAACDSERRPIAVFAHASCHATCLGHGFTSLHHDWPGHAASSAARRLVHDGAQPVVAIGIGAAGDINALDDQMPQGPGLAERQGERVGEAIARGAARAFESAGEQSIETALWRFDLADRIVDGDPSTELSDRWVFGAPALAGAEDGRSPLHTLGLAPEHKTSRAFSPHDPQHPKAPALGPLQRAVAAMLALEGPRELPVSLLCLGTTAIVGLPLEPTIVAAHRIARAVAEARGASHVSVLGYANDYAGYLTTPEEYARQAYEGASTLWGRNSLPHVIARLSALAARRR